MIYLLFGASTARIRNWLQVSPAQTRTATLGYAGHVETIDVCNPNHGEVYHKRKIKLS